jgi:hypothetical protein
MEHGSEVYLHCSECGFTPPQQNIDACYRNIPYAFSYQTGLTHSHYPRLVSYFLAKREPYSPKAPNITLNSRRLEHVLRYRAQLGLRTIVDASLTGC